MDRPHRMTSMDILSMRAESGCLELRAPSKKPACPNEWSLLWFEIMRELSLGQLGVLLRWVHGMLPGSFLLIMFDIFIYIYICIKTHLISKKQKHTICGCVCVPIWVDSYIPARREIPVDDEFTAMGVVALVVCQKVHRAKVKQSNCLGAGSNSTAADQNW